MSEKAGLFGDPWFDDIIAKKKIRRFSPERILILFVVFLLRKLEDSIIAILYSFIFFISKITG